MSTLSPHHVALTVEDLDGAVKWYKDVFGFEMTNRHTAEDANMQMALLRVTDGFYLELFHFVGTTQSLPDYRKDLMTDLRTVGTKHLCLRTTNLDAEIKRLNGKGVELIGKKDSTFFGGNYIFIKDPSGNLIELYETK